MDTGGTAPGISNPETKWRRVINLTNWLPLGKYTQLPNKEGFVRIPGPV
jgi:hypothetical protein